jgi:hypothetical protein
MKFPERREAIMKKISLAISLGAIFAAAGLAETMSGTVGDSMCGAKHEGAAANDAACVKKCVKGGASPIIISDGKVYQISAGSQAKVVPLLGMKVTVNGKLDGDTIDIAKVEAAKE